MKESYLINYKLFCDRKSFSLDSFLSQELLKNKEYAYLDLKKYLNDRKVQSPPESLFDDVKNNILESFIKAKEAKKEKLEEKKTSVVKQKPRVRSRKRKKNDQWFVSLWL